MQCPLVTPSKLIAGSCMVARGAIREMEPEWRRAPLFRGDLNGCSAPAVALVWAIRSGNHCNSRIRFGGACKGERRRAVNDTDT
jgi:hypothetical protein